METATNGRFVELGYPLFLKLTSMNNMAPFARTKAAGLTAAVTSDPRWVLEDELLCQTFGFTLYGYMLGVGRVVCFLDVEDVKEIAAKELIGLGIGPEYAKGMMDHAHQEFAQENNQSFHAQLVNVGHSYFAAEEIDELVESVYLNAAAIRKQMEEQG